MSTENENKMRMVNDLMNGSKYKTIAQQFFVEKNIQAGCKYVHTVSDPVLHKPASHTFQSESVGQYIYHAKVNRKTNSVTEWYRANATVENGDPRWVALDISTGQPIEYYLFDDVDGLLIEKKFDSVTKQQLVTNYFQQFHSMTPEQQYLIKDLPFKRTSYMWANKPTGFTVEFLPYCIPDAYEGVNMANLVLLEV
jgi:hypothetical protein